MSINLNSLNNLTIGAQDFSEIPQNTLVRDHRDDDEGLVRDHRGCDDGFRLGGNDHDADDRGIDFIHPRQDPDRLQDDRERLGKDERRLNRDNDRCQDDLDRINDDLENGNWNALSGDINRFGKDLQHYGRDLQRYDRDEQRYEHDLRGNRPQNWMPLLNNVCSGDDNSVQDTAEIQALAKLR